MLREDPSCRQHNPLSCFLKAQLINSKYFGISKYTKIDSVAKLGNALINFFDKKVGLGDFFFPKCSRKPNERDLRPVRLQFHAGGGFHLVISHLNYICTYLQRSFNFLLAVYEIMWSDFYNLIRMCRNRWCEELLKKTAAKFNSL